jgi:hypothetical protein
MACIAAPAGAADGAMATAANAATPQRNSISDCTGGSGDAVEAKRPELHPAGSAAALQLQQQHLQQLISSQHAALSGTGVYLSGCEWLVAHFYQIRRSDGLFEGLITSAWVQAWAWPRTVSAHCRAVAVGRLRPVLFAAACARGFNLMPFWQITCLIVSAEAAAQLSGQRQVLAHPAVRFRGGWMGSSRLSRRETTQLP